MDAINPHNQENPATTPDYNDESVIAANTTEGGADTADDTIPVEDVEFEVSEFVESAEEEGTDDDGSGAERLQKLIARAGIASRRAAEDLIAAGKVSINGHVVREPGVKADLSRDLVIVNGHPLRASTAPATVVLLHKPRGVVTTKNDPEGRPTVFDIIPRLYQTLHTVGRLDYDTSGLLLLTDDGALTQLLTHPSHGVTKTYHARVRGTVTLATLKKLEKGVRLEDGPTAPCRARVKVQTAQNALVEITLHEGRNRQVRRMLEAVGHPVASLRRVRLAQLDLEGVPIGQYRVLLPGEVHQLRKQADNKSSDTRSRPAAKKPLKTSSKPVKADARTAEPRKSDNLKVAGKTSPAPAKPNDHKSSRPARSVTVAKPLRGQKPRERAGQTEEARSTTHPKAGRPSRPAPPSKPAPAQARNGAGGSRPAQRSASAPGTDRSAANERGRKVEQRPSSEKRQGGKPAGGLAQRIARQWKD